MRNRLTSTLIVLTLAMGMSLSAGAQQLLDQGLSSILAIIDKAIAEFNQPPAEGADPETLKQQRDTAAATIVNLSRTLGKLSYSRLQCGQADVLAEFTARVQQMPDEYRDAMRDGFQQGFDQSKEETPLLSDDECKRLTASRSRGEKKPESKVRESEKPEQVAKPEKKPETGEDRKKRALRLAEITGQLAWKRKFCGDDQVTRRDFNEVISKMPAEYREAAKKAYWKGYQHGKRLNKGMKQEDCPTAR
jgi:predicted secreted protein